MTVRMSSRRPAGRHRSRVSLRRAVTPSAYAFGVPTLVGVLVVALGTVAASAASLGGLRTSDLGAADGASAIHSDGINVQWTPAVSGATWVLDGITLTTPGTDTFAAGEKLNLGLINASGTEICGIALTSATSTASISVARAAINTACGTTGIDFSTIDRIAVAASR
jgi:hypothetical protein